MKKDEEEEGLIMLEEKDYNKLIEDKKELEEEVKKLRKNENDIKIK
jgi:hypothetical protein